MKKVKEAKKKLGWKLFAYTLAIIAALFVMEKLMPGELAGITIIVGPLVVIVMLIVYLCMSYKQSMLENPDLSMGPVFSLEDVVPVMVGIGAGILVAVMMGKLF